MNDILTNRYQNAKDLMTKMTSDSSDERLDCETILRNSHQWVLNENEFNAKEEFEKVLKYVL
jgi:BMFP domain-containing protein YqiC